MTSKQLFKMYKTDFKRENTWQKLTITKKRFRPLHARAFPLLFCPYSLPISHLISTVVLSYLVA